MAADLYSTLGVSKSSSQEEIKKAYRNLARRYHPDHNPDDPEAEKRFKEVQASYDTLSDPEKRRQYDSGGLFGFGGANNRGGGPGFGGDIGDILSTIFGRGRGRQSEAPRGHDIEAEAALSFEQAIEGAEVSVSVPKNACCQSCDGSGANPPSLPTRCSRCDGSGHDSQNQGLFSISQPCPRCSGSGEMIEDLCSQCRGSGLTRQTKRYRVKIPAGVGDGARIRLSGRGDDGPRRGAAGDLYVTTRVEASPVFKRRDDGNLEVVVPITIPEAIRGATVEVPTLDGTKRIKIAPGTKHATVQRLRGEGPAVPGKRERTDIHYRLEIEIPTEGDRATASAIDELAAALAGYEPRAKILATAAKSTAQAGRR